MRRLLGPPTLVCEVVVTFLDRVAGEVKSVILGATPTFPPHPSTRPAETDVVGRRSDVLAHDASDEGVEGVGRYPGRRLEAQVRSRGSPVRAPDGLCTLLLLQVVPPLFLT